MAAQPPISSAPLNMSPVPAVTNSAAPPIVVPAEETQPPVLVQTTMATSVQTPSIAATVDEDIIPPKFSTAPSGPLKDENSHDQPLSPAGKFLAFWAALSWRSKLRIMLCFVAFAVVVSLSISIGFTQRTKDFSPWVFNPTDDGSRRLTLGVSLVTIDVNVGTATFDWYIYRDSVCDYNNPDTPSLPSDCPRADSNSTVDIFIDPNTLSDGNGGSGNNQGQISSNNRPSTSFFRHNATALLDPLSSLPNFRTVLKVVTDIRGKGASLSSLQNYPFDVYTAEAFMFGFDSKTGAAANLTLGSAYGVAVGFKTTGTTNTADGHFISQRLYVSRAGLVQAFVVVIIMAVWLVTLMFTFLTICIICGYKFDISLLLVPIVTLFTITQLRSSMPGAPPGFGAIIDFVGTLPCLALTAMSATVIIILLVFRTTGNPIKANNMV